jgi:hypothetical protein
MTPDEPSSVAASKPSPESKPTPIPPREIAVDVRVTRVMSNTDNERPVRVTVTDKASGLEFLEMRFTLAEWGDVMTGHGSYDGATAQVRGLHHIGKRHEHLSESFGHYSSDDFGKAEAEAWCQAMLADGWDTAQTHRNNKGQTVAIVRRYVEPTDG